MKKLTVALIRISTDKQDTDLQVNEINNYYKKNNITIDKWIENVESGRKKKLINMEGAKEIKKLIQEDTLSTIIFYKKE